MRDTKVELQKILRYFLQKCTYHYLYVFSNGIKEKSRTLLHEKSFFVSFYYPFVLQFSSEIRIIYTLKESKNGGKSIQPSSFYAMKIEIVYKNKNKKKWNEICLFKNNKQKMGKSFLLNIKGFSIWPPKKMNFCRMESSLREMSFSISSCIIIALNEIQLFKLFFSRI